MVDRSHDYTPKDWNSLYKYYRREFALANDDPNQLWVFRGQRNESWELETSLERSWKRWPTGSSTGRFSLIEEGLIREFQRRLHSSSPDFRVPELDDILGWLALMQHFGAPTRLLDWTYSFFVALYFAIESADGKETPAVWAIDVRASNRAARIKLGAGRTDVEAMLKKDPYISRSETFRELFARETPIPLVYRVNSYYLNPRITAQQGLFLCPGDVEKPFKANTEGLVLRRILIKPTLQEAMVKELMYMNIGRHSLFPGIDGLAGSLHASLAVPDRLMPPWRTKRGHAPFTHWRPYEEDC